MQLHFTIGWNEQDCSALSDNCSGVTCIYRQLFLLLIDWYNLFLIAIYASAQLHRTARMQWSVGPTNVGVVP